MSFGKVIVFTFCVVVSLFVFSKKVFALDQIYISQVQIAGSSTTDDFVEIFNPNDTPFNLNGFRLVKRTQTGGTDTSLKSWNTDTFIPAKSFFLWANSSYVNISPAPDTTTSGSIASDNGVAIRFGANDTGQLVDSIAWGSASNSFRVVGTNPSANFSLFRADLYDSNSVFNILSSNPRNSLVSDSGNINPSPSPAPSPLPAPTPTSPAPTTPAPSPSPSSFVSTEGFVKHSNQIKISEIYPNPSGEDTGEEKIEFYNSGIQTSSLEGWFLDDGTSPIAKNSAWQILQTRISPGEYLVLTVPRGHFVLNNSGGDRVNLYFEDKTLADTVSYKENAEEGLSFQKVDGVWLWSSPTLGKENMASQKNTAPGNTNSSDIFLSKIQINPVGEDEDNQWVEICSTKNTAVNLKNFALDTGSISEAKLVNSLVLDENYVLLPKDCQIVNLTADSFSLKIYGGSLRLFDPQSKLLDMVVFPKAEVEGQIYQKQGSGVWKFQNLKINQEDLKYLPQLKISEIYPSPKTGEEEFVEIFNQEPNPVNLKNFFLKIDNRKTKLPNYFLASFSSVAISGEDLPGHLPNLGGSVYLLGPKLEEIASTTFPQILKGQSFQLTENNSYQFSSEPTPAQKNIFVQGAEVSKAENLQKNSTLKESPQTVELKKEILDLSNQVALLTQKIESLSEQLTEKPKDNLPLEDSVLAPVSKENSQTKYLLLSGFTLLTLFFIAFKYGKNVL